MNLTPTIEYDFRPDGTLRRSETQEGKTDSLDGRWEVTKVADNILTLRVALGRNAGTMTLKFTDADSLVESPGGKAETIWKRKKS
jgi:hypothetical protein